MKYLNIWLNYPLKRALSFMDANGWEIKSHVVIIGPIGICVLWRKRVAAKGIGDESCVKS